MSAGVVHFESTFCKKKKGALMCAVFNTSGEQWPSSCIVTWCMCLISLVPGNLTSPFRLGMFHLILLTIALPLRCSSVMSMLTVCVCVCVCVRACVRACWINIPLTDGRSGDLGEEKWPMFTEMSEVLNYCLHVVWIRTKELFVGRGGNTRLSEGPVEGPVL
jgi:hypothetical protein